MVFVSGGKHERPSELSKERIGVFNAWRLGIGNGGSLILFKVFSTSLDLPRFLVAFCEIIAGVVSICAFFLDSAAESKWNSRLDALEKDVQNLSKN